MELKKKTIDGESLVSDWNINYDKLSYLVIKYNLSVIAPPFLSYFELSFIGPQDLSADTESLLKNIQADSTWLSDKLFLRSELGNIVEQTDILDKQYEIDEFDNGLTWVDQCSSSAAHSLGGTFTLESLFRPSLIRTIENHEDGIRETDNVFSLFGKVWFVKYQQREWGLFPDHEKYQYLFHLLSRMSEIPDDNEQVPDASIYNTDLVSKVKGKDITLEFEDHPGGEEASSLDDVVSIDDLNKFKDIGYDLLEQLDNAEKSKNQFKLDEIQNIIDRFRHHLLNEYGIKCIVSTDNYKLYFKPLHRANKENEKIRQTVKNQIRNAIKDIKDCMPSLSRHLNNSIKTQVNKTVYQPEQQIYWHVSM